MEKQYDKSHGTPYDRGSADAYYHRMPSPHKLKQGELFTQIPLESHEELEAYMAGYNTEENRKQFDSLF